jgi:hypothetical protein
MTDCSEKQTFLSELNFFHEVLYRLKGDQALGMAELRVTETILRQMMLKRRRQIRLSYSQLEDLAGLSRNGVSIGLTSAIQRGTILKIGEGANIAYTFQVVTVGDSAKSSKAKEATDANLDQEVTNEDQSPTGTSPQRGIALVPNGDQSLVPNGDQSTDINYKLGDINKPKTRAARETVSFTHQFVALTPLESRHFFDRFVGVWPDYQNKIAKPAWEVWLQINPSATLAEQIIQGAEVHVNGKRFQECLRKDHGRYYPSLAKWLNDESWKDSVIPWTPADEYFTGSIGQANLRISQQASERKARGEPVIRATLPPPRRPQ